MRARVVVGLIVGKPIADPSGKISANPSFPSVCNNSGTTIRLRMVVVATSVLLAPMRIRLRLASEGIANSTGRPHDGRQSRIRITIDPQAGAML